MGIIWYLVSSVLVLLTDILLLMMLVSAVMSWIAPDIDHPIMKFINSIVETLVYPVRRLLSRFEFVRNCPLDISFYVTSVLLVLLQALLTSI